MRKEITIGIAEDHPVTRFGLVAALKQQKSFSVLFDVSNGKELLDELKTIAPDVLLLDIRMPIMTAQEVLEKMKSKFPKIKVIIISAFYSEEYIVECFKLGVVAFLQKGEAIEKVIEVINTVYIEGIYTDTEVSKILANQVKNPRVGADFTAKERQIIRLICSGLSIQEAAEQQQMSVDGLNYHLRKIRNKTGTKNKTGLREYAIKHNLLGPKP